MGEMTSENRGFPNGEKSFGTQLSQTVTKVMTGVNMTAKSATTLGIYLILQRGA